MENAQHFLNRAWYMCKRPGMYTPTGACDELLAALHGLELGLFPANSSPMAGFASWLASKFAVPQQIWFATFRAAAVPDGHTAQSLWELLSAYFKEAHQIEARLPHLPACCGYAQSPDHRHD